ncbi:MAG: hypothetical protein OXU94_10060 [Gammaproteobacteria bacterium]|nr:hypothetical protein [Gammaproteobacteria bacterium]
MRGMKKALLLVMVAAAAGLAADARGGYFDCTVVYDEFHSLMNKRFLREPDLYVPVAEERFTRNEFLAAQKGIFSFGPGRPPLGIAVVATNRNTRGKLLLDWEQPEADGVRPLVIAGAVLYGRVDDGYAPRRLAPIRIKPGFALDLDSGRQVEAVRDAAGLPGNAAGGLSAPDPAADVIVGMDGANLYLRAVNGARLWFPLESMCHRLN